MHGLCLPGLGLETYETCGRMFADVLWMYMPGNQSEAADCIQELMGSHDNGFELLWYMLKVVVGMMDTHVVPTMPVYKRKLSRHTGCWDVHQMMMMHQGTRFTQHACTITFLRSVVCPRFRPAAKVELGIFMNAIPYDSRRTVTWAMPRKYEVQTVAQRILQEPLEATITTESLGKMGQPTFLRLAFDDADNRDGPRGRREDSGSKE